ncbi:hypothetical protein RTP6_002735 [Batrachochytrium dendrobatidis]
MHFVSVFVSVMAVMSTAHAASVPSNFVSIQKRSDFNFSDLGDIFGNIAGKISSAIKDSKLGSSSAGQKASKIIKNLEESVKGVFGIVQTSINKHNGKISDEETASGIIGAIGSIGSSISDAVGNGLDSEDEKSSAKIAGGAIKMITGVAGGIAGSVGNDTTQSQDGPNQTEALLFTSTVSTSTAESSPTRRSRKRKSPSKKSNSAPSATNSSN